MKVKMALVFLIVLGIGVAVGLQACGKKNGFGVGGKVIINGSGG